jgi:RHS repeat-associated protein
LAVVNTATPATYYVHVDHLNRPVMMTDGAKAQVWAATWQAWGGLYSITGPQANDARFPGQWFQLESGLHYNWHRHYDPSIGRYTQPDPLGFVDGPSVYAYTKNLPQSRVDFDGRDALFTGPWDPKDKNCFEGCVQGERQYCALLSMGSATFCMSPAAPKGPIATPICTVATACAAYAACEFGINAKGGGTGVVARCRRTCNAN